MSDLRADVLKRLDGLLQEGRRIDASFAPGKHYTESNLPEEMIRAFLVGSCAEIERVAGRESEYHRHLPDLGQGKDQIFQNRVKGVLASLIALRDAVDQGLLARLEQRVRANVYDDFLVQAGELLKAGYHVAAIVLAGGVLEEHLGKLCAARSLVWKGDGSISKYNDLLRDVVYDQPAWRRIQQVGDLRNLAAHGKGADLKADDVVDAVKYISRAIADYPS